MARPYDFVNGFKRATDLPALGGLFKAARLKLGLSREDLAAEVGCSLSYITFIENDYRPKAVAIRRKVLATLERLAGVSA